MKIPVFDENDKMHVFETNEVICIRKDDKSRKFVVCVNNKEYYAPSTLKQYVDIFGPAGFYQIDKNKIINTTLIDKYDEGDITIGDSEYRVSRRNRKGLEDILGGN